MNNIEDLKIKEAEEVLLNLVKHDIAQDMKENIDHCLELNHAISFLQEVCSCTYIDGKNEKILIDGINQ